MQKHVAFVVLMGVAVGFVGCATNGSAQSEAAVEAEGMDGRIESESVTMVVRGMSCPKCADNIDLQLRSVRGVRDVAIDLGAGEVKVAVDPMVPPTRSQLAQAIRRSGFSLVSIDTP